MHKRSSGSLLLAFALYAFVALGCSGDSQTAEPRGRVLVLGIDGATLRVIEPMMQAGRLPVLAKIAEEGAYGPLRSQLPLLSPRIWNSIATGKTPEKHGIGGFTAPLRGPRQGGERKERGERKARLLASTDRRVHALWNIVSDAGMSAVVVNWWNTDPPEKIDGVMVSDHLVATEVEGRMKALGVEGEVDALGLVHPASWVERILPLMKERKPPVEFADPFLGRELPRWGLRGGKLSRRFGDDALVASVAEMIEAEEHPDLTMVLLVGIDRVSHSLWGVLEPADLYPERLHPAEAERESGREALEAYYEYSDALIGALSRNFGENDLVVVVSDHGFEAGVELGLLTGVHDTESAIDGVIFARGPGVAPGGRIEGMSILDVTPTLLAWMGLPVGDDMDGEVSLAFGERAPSRVATHDLGTVERVSASGGDEERRILRELRELGYID